jgi:hypothetical protein
VSYLAIFLCAFAASRESLLNNDATMYASPAFTQSRKVARKIAGHRVSAAARSRERRRIKTAVLQ